MPLLLLSMVLSSHGFLNQFAIIIQLWPSVHHDWSRLSSPRIAVSLLKFLCNFLLRLCYPSNLENFLDLFWTINLVQRSIGFLSILWDDLLEEVFIYLLVDHHLRVIDLKQLLDVHFVLKVLPFNFSSQLVKSLHRSYNLTAWILSREALALSIPAFVFAFTQLDSLHLTPSSLSLLGFQIS